MTTPLDMATLPEQLLAGRAARVAALAAYLDALPVVTTNHWECFTCMLLDFWSILDEATTPQHGGPDDGHGRTHCAD